MDNHPRFYKPGIRGGTPAGYERTRYPLPWWWRTDLAYKTQLRLTLPTLNRLKKLRRPNTPSDFFKVVLRPTLSLRLPTANLLIARGEVTT
jgi:hypothetical protein